ncbi:MAG: hypothetical protein EBZ36_10610, partial [Acidobacteria bacterium]|nr:hypothetical protein [Acidobacteriota bacterium]
MRYRFHRLACYLPVTLLFISIVSVRVDGQERYLQRVASHHSKEEFQSLTRGSQRAVVMHRSAQDGPYRALGDGVVRELTKGKIEMVPRQGVLPVSPVRVVRRVDEQTIYFGTDKGLIRYSTRPGEVTIRYLAGRRWLLDDRVLGIATGPRNAATGEHEIWVETPAGYTRISEKLMTLSEKAAIFEERIRKRHVRHGMTSGSILTRPGETESNRTVSSDNDGLWTALYVAAESFRYKVTGEPEAREFARQGMQALIRLEEITGRPGFPARSFIRKGQDIQPGDGEWHDTPDGLWRWKGDTSSDEIAGHYFVYPIYYDLVADDSEKAGLRAVITRITDHILDNDFQLIDLDGKRTRWGWWGPEAIWEDATETGLRALHLLAHLRTAHHLTGNPRYERTYQELITRHKYHLLTRNQKINYPGYVNHSDDELAFISYYPLLQYEKDTELRKTYLDSLDRAWQVERPERNPLWNFIFAACARKTDYDRAESLRTLREIPLDLIEWKVSNSHRADIPRDAIDDRFNRAQALIVLPYDELSMNKWNDNPYLLDGGA